MQLSLVTFADRKYQGSLRRLAAEARALGVFANIDLFDETRLGREFWTQHRDFIVRNPRLFGYGLWKPHVAHLALSQIPEGTVLLYCDAGCSLNREGLGRLQQYLEMVSAEPGGLLGFHCGYPEAAWTKMDLLQRLAFTADPQLQSPQMCSGMFFAVKSAGTMDFLRSWSETMSDYHLIDDSPSRELNHASFREHRHDQSVFSILFKQRGGRALPDETFWPGQWEQKREYPIHARRWKHWQTYSREQLEGPLRHWVRIERRVVASASASAAAKTLFYPRSLN